MKKNVFRVLSVAAVGALMASCNNQSPKMDASPAGDEPAGMRIAFVEIDSLTSQYEYAKLMNDSLEKKRANLTNTLTRKGKEFESSYANFQQKVQNNGFTSREQFENAQAALQREQNNLTALQARLENELAGEQAKFLKALQDSLDNFLTVYNADKKYDMIVNKAAVLFADQKYDITQDVINGLNKRHKKDGAKAEAPAKVSSKSSKKE